MKTKHNSEIVKNAIFIGICFFIIISCSKNEVGNWDDIIKLSTKKVDLKATTDSVIITTGGDWWWIDAITFEDSIYSYYHRDDINLESNSYTILEDSFKVERRNKNTLFVKINENNTGIEREMRISLEAGNYFDYVIITQAAY